MPDTPTKIDIDIDIDIDIRVFCATEPKCGYDITQPFARSGWRCATDGRIAVRIPDDGPDTEGTFPKVEFVFEGFPVCDQPLPAAVTVEIDCRYCLGKGKIPGPDTCFVCNGAKRIVTRRGTPRDRFPDGVIELVGYQFDPWYLYLIESRCQNVRHAAAVATKDRLCFMADGGVQIVLMSLFLE